MKIKCSHSDDYLIMENNWIQIFNDEDDELACVGLTDHTVAQLADALYAHLKIVKPADQAIPMLLWCPQCGERHIDAGEKLHHTHACQECGHVWRPAIVATVGVKYLPGFKDEI